MLVLTCVYVHVFNTWHVNFQMFGNKRLSPEYEHMDSTTVVLSELQSGIKCHQAMADLWGNRNQHPKEAHLQFPLSTHKSK